MKEAAAKAIEVLTIFNMVNSSIQF
jgi:hypothetical protein